MNKFKSIKRVLAVMLTMVLLTQNCSSVFAAEGDISGTDAAVAVQPLAEEAGGGEDNGAPDISDGTGENLDNEGNSDGGQDDIGGGQDSESTPGNDAAGGNDQVDEDNSGDGSAEDGTGSDESTGGDINDDAGDGSVDDGTGNDGTGDDGSQGEDGTGKEPEDKPGEEIPGSAVISVPGSSYIENVEYSYTAPEGENPWASILSVESAGENEIPENLSTYFNGENNTVVSSEFFKVTCSEEKENIPAFTASLKQGISLNDGQELYFYSEGNYNSIDFSNGSALAIPYRTVWGFVLVEKKAPKIYDISRGQEYTSWINHNDSGLYYKEKGVWVKYTPESEHEFVTGEDIKIGIAYQIPQDITIYPGDKICYQMELGDSGAVLNNQTGVKVTLSGSEEVVGSFDIDGNGLITVSYYESWLTEGGIPGRNGISTQLEASGSLNFSGSGDDNGYKYIYIGDVELKFKVKEKEKKAAITVDKAKAGNRTRDEQGNVYQTFKVTINALANNTIPINQLKIHDYFRYGEKRYVKYMEDSLKVESHPNGLDVTITEDAGDDSKDFYLTLDILGSENKKGFGGDGKAEKIVINYQVKIDKSIWFANMSGANGSFSSNITLRNTADVTGEDVSGKGTDWEEMSFPKTWFEKTGSIIKNTEDGNAKLHYAVHVNKNPMIDIKGWTVRDTLLEPNTIHRYDPSSIFVNKYGGTDGKKLIGQITPDIKSETTNGKTYEYLEFVADGPYYYELQYDTIVTLNDDEYSAGELKNKIELIAPADSGIGTAPSYTVGVNYDVFSIEKKVLDTPDYAGRQITWQTTLHAYRNGGSNGDIPRGAIYTDDLSLEEAAKSHSFDWENLNLVITDKDDTVLTDGTDYNLSKGSHEKSFTVEFLRDVSDPVKITYNSSADFGKGEGNDEIYINTGVLTVQTDVKSATAKVKYKSSNVIKKEVFKQYNSNTREISWRILVNAQKRSYPEDSKLQIIDKLPKGLTVKNVRYETASNPFHGYETDADGNLVIDYTGHMKEINGKQRNIVIVCTVDDVSGLIGDNGEVTFTNTVGFYLNDVLVDTASAEAKAKFEVLDKKAKYDKNSPERYVEYTVNVNTAGNTLGDGNGNLSFIDQMDNTMSLAPNSLKVVNLSTGSDITASCKLTLDTENHKFTVEIPDSTPLRISYNVNFNEYAEIVQLTNSAQLYYQTEYIDGDVNSEEFEVKQASGSATANPDIIVYKVDGSDANRYLGGAVFNLYRLNEGKNPESTDMVNDWTFEKEVTSDSQGKVYMTNLKKETYYCLVETKAPDGYVWNASAKYVFIYADINSQMTIPEQYYRISQNKGGFYITNNKAQLAVDKKFYGGDGAQLADGEYPDGLYYFGVFDEQGSIVNTLSNEKAFGQIRVSGGKVQNPTAGKYPLVFELEMGSYTVYETDAQGNILADTDDDGFVTINGLEFEADRDGHISTEITVDKNAYPAVAVVNNRLFSDDVRLTLRVGKTLDGRELTAGEFQFQIVNEQNEKVAEGVNDESGNITFTPVSYAFDSVGEHTYTIKEVKGNDPEITYSEVEFKLTVSVKNQNGILVIDKVSIKGDEEQDITIQKDEDGVYDASSTVIFENIYEKTIIQPVSLVFKGNKVLENKEMQGREFSFILTPVNDDSPIRLKGQDYEKHDSLVVKNDENGQIQFPPMYYIAEDAGKTFKYEIKEQLPQGADSDNPVKDGITYTTETRTLTVSVTEEDRNLKVSAKLDGIEYPLEGDSESLIFTNTYHAEGSFTLDAAKKVEGRELLEQKFKFSARKYKKQGDTWIEAGFKEKAADQVVTKDSVKTVENRGAQIDFGGDYFELTDAGEYRYVIEEMDTTLGGYTKDDTKFAVDVEVSDNGDGTLKTSKKGIYIIDSEGKPVGDNLEQVEFVNTYKTTGTETVLTVQKNLIGKELKAGQFTFKLEEAKNVDWRAEGFDLETVEFTEVSGNTEKANDSKGLVTFDPISYTTEGKHVYKITENIPEEANVSNGYKADGYTYSTEPVYVFVEVSDNGDGTLKAEQFGNRTKDAYRGVITNIYESEGEVILNGTKKLSGRKLEQGQFEFTMDVARADGEAYPAEEDYKTVANVTNGDDGKFSFPVQKFAVGGAGNKNDTGIYFYRIRERVPEDIPEGYTYLSDGIKEHIIKVTVEKSADGSLKITKTMADGSKLPAEGVVFNNAYNAKGQWKPEATKVLSGSPLTEGQFAFELLKDNSVVQTVMNKADGTISFDEIVFTQEDMNNQKEMDLEYYVREKIPSDAADGIGYDRTLYKISIHLEDKENGKIEVTESIIKDTGDSKEEADKISFTNTFSGSASIFKTEEDGRTPLAGAMFELYEANGSGYSLRATYTTGSSGRVTAYGLPANDYYFVETMAPEGYVIPKDADGNPVKYAFTIGVNDGVGKVENAVVDYTQTVVNSKGLGAVELTKYDSEDRTAVLANAKFGMYTSAGTPVNLWKSGEGSYVYLGGSKEDAVTELVTGSNGKISVSGLEWGTYYFQETEAPDGYVLSDQRISFTVNAGSFNGKGEPAVIALTAVNTKTKVTIEKVDEQGTGLAGAVLAIRDSKTNEMIETWTSDGKPHLIEGKLIAGRSYYLSEQSAPEGYQIAPEQEFTVPESGEITVTMIDKKEETKNGGLTVVKNLSLVDEEMNIVEAFAKDYTTYVGIFTDAEGLHPYDGDYIREIKIQNGSSGQVEYSNLPSGIYYIFETDANGAPIPYDELHTNATGSFVCMVDGEGNVNINTDGGNLSGTVTLNNVYYDFPDGFSYRGYIDISKKVLKNGARTNVDDTFYAGVFTIGSDGVYELLPDMVFELAQNDTIKVEVPLGGENGDEAVTYFIMETDAEGNPVSSDESFAYNVSGEGEVSLDVDNTTGSITITNEIIEEVTITEKPDSSTPSGGGTTGNTNSTKVTGVKTGDATMVWPYLLLLAAAAGMIGILGNRGRKKKK
ncbi:SpaA isopeptide-forming pilin-related protein [Blautia schinkii]|nr:SpaA isopeptide-forming pilin-related protein [Blautia schinkii]